MTVAAEHRPGDEAADAPLDCRLQLDGELLAYAALLALALILRLWDLGARALHHDESMHAYYALELFRGRGYAHDPLLHGTVPYIFNAVVYFLLGATDATARLVPALLGTALVAVPYVLRPWLGRPGALATAALLALSPSFLYFSRFIREDIYAALFTLVIVAAMFAYWRTRQSAALHVLAVALAFSFASKEVTYINAGIFGSFLLAVGWRDLLTLLRRGGPLSPAGDLLVVLGTLVAPQAAGLGLVLKRWLGLPMPSMAEVSSSLVVRLGLAFDPLLLGVFAALVATTVAIGLRWDAERWPRVALSFYLAFGLLFTTLLSNPPGFFTGAISGLAYWVTQHEVQRGAQPWFYYFLLLPLYEFVVVGFGLLGIVWAAARRELDRLLVAMVACWVAAALVLTIWVGERVPWPALHATGVLAIAWALSRRELSQPFVAFLVWWAAGALLLYGWAGEKMPWLVLHVALPWVLLAGRAIGDLLGGVDWSATWRQGGWRVPLGLALAAAVLLGLSRLPPGAEATPLERQRALYQVALLAFFLVLAIGWVGGAAAALGWRIGWRAIALSILGLLALFSIRTGWQATYAHGDVAVEMLVYTQTTPDVQNVMRDIERVAFRTGAGKDLRVAYDSETSWPFEWYLREYRGRAFYGQGLPPADAPIVLVGIDNGHDARVRPVLAGRYVGQRYRLRWWFQEEYKGLAWAEVKRTPFDAGLRTRLWNYLLYRETAPLGSTDFMLYVRRDLVGGAWMPAPTVVQRQAEEQALAAREQEV
ncbi:MAG: TIGR03663 family protein, partial [Chloroflexi bacterium]|nr:TIGR03663 family protein [Chloroflexota bacterium]